MREKRMMKQWTLFLVCIAIVLSACGSSDQNSVVNDGVLIGTFIFGPVEGLSYTCGDLSGKTDSDGRFEYYEEETITFSVGELIIGEAEGTVRISPADFEGELNVTGICQFLMACDEDDNPNNGIQISPVFNNILVEDEMSLELSGKDFCFDLKWYGTDYRLFYNDPDMDGICDEIEGVAFFEVKLEADTVGSNVFTLFDSDFELHPGLVNLFIEAFGNSINSDTVITYHEDPDDITHGYFSSLWGLPDTYRDYNRRLAKKILNKALNTPYTGVYSGTYSTDEISGELNFRLYLTPQAECNVDSVYNGSTYGDTPVDIYGNITDSKTGLIVFGLSGSGLRFKGYADPDTGEIRGDVQNSNYDIIGSFACERS